MQSNSHSYSVIAFYGFDVSTRSCLAYYEALLRWFDERNCRPDKLGVHGNGFSGKLANFSRTNGRLRRSGFQRVTSIELHSKLPSEEAPIVESKMSADLSLKNSYAILAADSSLIPLQDMLSIAHVAVEHLQPCYGIGYLREQRLGPSFYAIGLNYGRHTVFFWS